MDTELAPELPKILIVDDKKVNLFTLERVLRKINATVIKAHSGNGFVNFFCFKHLNKVFQVPIFTTQINDDAVLFVVF